MKVTLLNFISYLSVFKTVSINVTKNKYGKKKIINSIHLNMNMYAHKFNLHTHTHIYRYI